MPDATLSGGCMCGAVRFEVKGQPTRVINCHCESCRRHTGAPMSTMAVLTAEQVTFSGTPRKAHESAPGVVRAFCGDCGTSMTWETDHPHYGPLCSLHIGTFDDPDALKPDSHSFYGEQVCWFDAADDLPRYRGFVADGDLVRHGPSKKLGEDGI